MKNSLFGGWSINSSTIIDSHILLMLIPAFLLAVVWMSRKLLKTSVAAKKTQILSIVGLTLITTFVLTSVETFIYKQSELTAIGQFSNLDFLVSLVIGLALITRRYGIARMLIPAAIVLGATRLINNPGAFLSTSEALNAIALMSLPVLTIVLTNRTVSIKGFAFATSLNIALLIYVGIVNHLADTNFSTITNTGLNHNFFYGLFYTQELKLFMFILASIVFEVIVWVFIRFAFWKENQKGISSFKRSFINEVKTEKQMAIKYGTKVSTLKDIETETLTDSLPILEIENQDQTSDMFENLSFEENDSVVLLPFSIIRNRNAQGIRAPSL